jgi:hypothetical protein
MRLIKARRRVPQRAEKSLEGVKQAESLGVYVDGKRGEVGVARFKRAALMRSGLMLAAHRVPPRRILRAWLAKYMNMCLLRRPAMSCLQYSLRYALGTARWGLREAREVLCACFLIPLLQTDLRARMHESIFATDASLTGGCVVRAPCDARLAEQLLTACDFRGASVRLPHLPPALTTTTRSRSGAEKLSIDPRSLHWSPLFRWHWRNPQHITLLEAHAFLMLVRWLARSQARVRFFQLFDSEAAKAACAKGRSPAFRLNAVCRRVAACLLAADAQALYAWVSTHYQPADEGSRL